LSKSGPKWTDVKAFLSGSEHSGHVENATSDEHRTEARSNIFVTATLHASGGTTPVRIRNMSRHGALVEAAALPPSGQPMRLSRGNLSVAGEIMWVAGAKAGLHFESDVAVGDWLPHGHHGGGPQPVERSANVISQAAPNDPATGRAVATAEELHGFQQMLERAGEQLAADPAIAARHMMSLQLIYGVVKGLAKLAAGPDAAA
jgi:hypothetical protein